MDELTSREYDVVYMAIEDFPTRRALSKSRNAEAERILRPLLKAGDVLRATRAECCAHEASFKFDHWEGGWIVSRGGRSIAPSSVYSVNGQVIRFVTKFVGPVQPDPPRKVPFFPIIDADAGDDCDGVPW